MKTAQMQIKVAPHIHKRLKLESQRRGVSLNALAGWLFGEWVTNLERIEESAKEQIKLTERLLSSNLEEGLNKGMMMAIEEHEAKIVSTDSK